MNLWNSEGERNLKGQCPAFIPLAIGSEWAQHSWAGCGDAFASRLLASRFDFRFRQIEAARFRSLGK
jgi:hypothetical protein